MKPMIILPPNTMSEKDIEILRKNEICVVVAKDPSRVKFVDPIPAQSSRTEIEGAAIQLSRILLNGQWANQGRDYLQQGDFAKLYIQCLMKGTALDARGTVAEQEQAIVTAARRDELQRMARETARAERAAAKAAQFEQPEKAK